MCITHVNPGTVPAPESTKPAPVAELEVEAKVESKVESGPVGDTVKQTRFKVGKVQKACLDNQKKPIHVDAGDGRRLELTMEDDICVITGFGFGGAVKDRELITVARDFVNKKKQWR